MLGFDRVDYSYSTLRSGVIKSVISMASLRMTSALIGRGVTSGQSDHKIDAQLKIDDLCAILAIVSVVSDAEYTSGERTISY